MKKAKNIKSFNNFYSQQNEQLNYSIILLKLTPMISGFAVILENEILYCSNDTKYTLFEIVLFVQKLLKSVNPRHNWRLKDIFLGGEEMGNERMLIRHALTNDNRDLFYCISGDFKTSSQEVHVMLDEFYKSIAGYYLNKDINLLKLPSEKSLFREFIEYVIFYLKDKYEEILTLEEYKPEIKEAKFRKIIYAGISTQGLPICNRLYDKKLVSSSGKDLNDENIELFSSDLSAKLATITMNTMIRAKTNIKEIHFEDIEQKGEEKIILYGKINGYSFDFIASGDFLYIKTIFKYLVDEISKEQVFHEEFAGDLKPYKHLQQYLDKIRDL
jgi:hypothetical protein